MTEEPPRLRRELGRLDLTAIGVNQVIGSAIFLMPSQVAALVGGGWSPIAFVAVGFASLLVALCFAEVGSRFSGTGGPYLYTRAAFGRFAGFEVGWMQWFTRVTSHASVVNGLTLALAYFWPPVASGTPRIAFISLMILGTAAINVVGIRQSAWTVDILTAAKLLPLAVFIGVGLFFVDPARIATLPPIDLGEAGAAALLLVFVFGGYDVVPVPAGEAKDPRRDVPFALIATIGIVTLVMTLAQAVTVGTLPGLAESKTPLADAARGFMGPAGAVMIGIGAAISMTGHGFGGILNGSRMLFAMAEQGDLPRFLGRIHPRFRTPANSILFTTAISLALALSGSFVVLATASAVARLVAYTGACGATWRLRHGDAAANVPAASFVVPGGAVVPLLAILISLTILAGASSRQLLGGAAALAAGALLFALRRPTDRPIGGTS